MQSGGQDREEGPSPSSDPADAGTEGDEGHEADSDPIEDTPIVARASVTSDGVMTEDRLLELIDLDREEDALDFKRTYDLRLTEDLVKCVKVVVSMANSGGGYIVLGVEEVSGTDRRYTVLGCPADHLGQLDPTDLHSKLERYVEEPLDVRIRVFRPDRHGGVPIVLIFVPPTRTLPLTFKILGQYSVSTADGRVRTQVEFRPGEIWVRRGAACVQPNARDWRRIRSDIRRAERARWSEDLLGVTPLVQRLDRIAILLERLLESGGLATTGRRPEPGLTSADYLLPPAELARRLADLLENEEP